MTVFQPHLYSRTQDFLEGFARSFFNSDVLVVTDVFSAREEPIPGVDGDLLAQTARRYGHRSVHYVKETEQLVDRLAEITRPGDTLITMGAGDIYRSGRAFLKHLQEAI